jgi:hypothetical protein
VALDLQRIERVLPVERELVVYGGGVFPSLRAGVVTRESARRVRTVGPEASDAAAAVGVVALLEIALAADGGESGEDAS